STPCAGRVWNGCIRASCEASPKSPSSDHAKVAGSPVSDGTGPPASVLKRAGFFLVVGAILFVLFDQFGPYQSGRGYRPRPIETISGSGVVLERTFDGHYYLTGSINGREVVFMVDTGASTVAIGDSLARTLDLGPCRTRQYST